MWRKVALVMISLALGGAAPGAPNQHEPMSSTTQSVIVEQNPVIKQLMPLEPTIASEVILKLQRITTGAAVPGTRAGVRPSASELAQINANPAFAQAYQHDPDGTLVLLRWVNGEIALHHQQRAHDLH